MSNRSHDHQVLIGTITLAFFTGCARPARVDPSDTSNRGCTFAGIRSSEARQGTGGGPYFAFMVDSTGSFAPDGRGPYVHHEDGVHSYVQNSGIRLYIFGALATGASAEPTGLSRRLRIDLSHPAEAGTPDLGIREVSRWVVHWRQDNERKVIYGLLDMRVGTESLSERMEIHVPIGGRTHILRMGNMQTSVCWQEDSLPSAGTTPARVRRLSQDEWSIELPPHTRGRLSEQVGQLPDVMSIHFADRGLYEVSGRLTIRARRVP